MVCLDGTWSQMHTTRELERLLYTTRMIWSITWLRKCVTRSRSQLRRQEVVKIHFEISKILSCHSQEDRIKSNGVQFRGRAEQDSSSDDDSADMNWVKDEEEENHADEEQDAADGVPSLPLMDHQDVGNDEESESDEINEATKVVSVAHVSAASPSATGCSLLLRIMVLECKLHWSIIKFFTYLILIILMVLFFTKSKTILTVQDQQIRSLLLLRRLLSRKNSTN